MSQTELRAPPRTLTLYLLAAEADRAVCTAIVKYLRPVVRDSAVPIQLLNDFDVPAGDDVKAHKQRLLEADIVLALISADFIGDDDIYARIKAVTELHNRGKTVVIPLLVRNCLWKATPFAQLGMLPKNFQPLNNLQFWPSADDALMAVVADVYDALGKMTSRAAIPGEPAAAGAAQAVADPRPEVVAAAPAGPAPDARPRADAEPTPVPPENSVEVDWRRAYYRNVLWKRGGALVIDWVVAFAAWFVWLMVYFVVNPDGSETVNAHDLIFAFVLFYVLCPLLEASPWQATVGKRVMGLQITDRDGHRIGFGRAFVRNVVRSLVLYSYVFVIPLIVQLFRFRTTKKLFHDELSSTIIGERLASAKSAGLTPAVAR